MCFFVGLKRSFARMTRVIVRGLHEFMSRDWRAVREAKDAYWGERAASLGPLEGLRIADELRLQALAQDRAWPHAEDRHQDLLSHGRMADLLRRADAARRP